MSDLSSNSMSRDEIIRNARENCMRRIDNPHAYTAVETPVPGSMSEHTGMKKSTYARLFFSCLILLGTLAVKQFGLTYQNFNFTTIVNLVEDNSSFEKLQKIASQTLEEDVIPTFKQLKNSINVGK